MRLFARRQPAPPQPPPASASAPAPSAGPAEPLVHAKTRDESQFTEADILTILRAASQGGQTEELCASEGISLKTFETWKAKYGGLSLSQIKVRRRHERTSRRNIVVLAGLVIVGTLGWYASTLRSAPSVQPAPQPARKAAPAPALAATATPAPAAAATPAPAPAAAAAPAPTPAPAPAGVKSPAPAAAKSPVTAAATAPAATPATPPAAALAAAPPATAKATETPAPGTNVKPRDLGSEEPKGHSIQVAAVPTTDLAKALVDELGRGGYPAYLTRTTVNGALLYRVRVGPFESRDATQVIADRLEKAGYRGAWVIWK